MWKNIVTRFHLRPQSEREIVSNVLFLHRNIQLNVIYVALHKFHFRGSFQFSYIFILLLQHVFRTRRKSYQEHDIKEHKHEH